MCAGMNEAGCDEAGRGCLAGPVVAAAVILPDGFTHHLLRDSKTLTENQREEARQIIIGNALDYAIAWSTAVVIDKVNILNASILAMHKALERLSVKPQHIVIDGNRWKPWNYTPFNTVVKGDGKYANIAAASILAKTTRDHIMQALHDAMPVYGFATHKGYPTRAHYNAIEEHGPSPWHRFTFKGVTSD